MEIPLFQWSQVSRHPEWIPQIDTWFDKFEVGVIFLRKTFMFQNLISRYESKLRDFWYEAQKMAKKKKHER